VSHIFGLTIESLVAILLLLTIIYCARLNARLEKLRADEQVMKATIAELMNATGSAERAIAGLKLTIRECQDNLDPKLREAELLAAAIGENLKAGEDVIARLRKIAEARSMLARAEAEPIAPSLSDAQAMVAAAKAFAERARTRANGLAA
jgi:hypothetical protein